MKKNILILCGGPSSEHEISIRSAYNIYKYMDTSLFNPILVGISRTRQFYTITKKQLDELYANFGFVEDNMYPYAKLDGLQIDVCFPALHGAGGEDGSIQGYLESLNIPYVGNNVTASAICMDKDITKRLLESHNLPVVPFITAKQDDLVPYKIVSQTLGTTLFLKCVNQGSSIGTYKILNEQEYNLYLKEAFTFGPKVLIEKAIHGREIECAIIGNNKLEASVLGEIIPKSSHAFYDYNAKKNDQAQLIINAKIDPIIETTIKNLAKKAFKALDCSGLARVDFFLTDQNDVFINEINTLPGFTEFSLYPKLFMHNGITFTELITKLIHLAAEKNLDARRNITL